MKSLSKLQAIKAFALSKDESIAVQGGRSVEYKGDGSGACAKVVDSNDETFRKAKIKAKYEGRC